MAVGDKTYTPELAAEICERLSAGQSLRKICNDAHMPSEAAVRNWAIFDVQGFAAQYAHARELGYESMAEEILEIADGAVGTTDTGATDSGAVQQKRLQVDTRRWLLSKLLPKTFGDKQTIEHTGDVNIAARLAEARKIDGE